MVKTGNNPKALIIFGHKKKHFPILAPSLFGLISDDGVLDVAQDSCDQAPKGASIFDWSISSLDLDPSFFLSENSRLLDKSFFFDDGCLDILFNYGWAHLGLNHRLLSRFCDYRLAVLLEDDLSVLFVNHGLVLLMNDVFVLLVDHWLVNLLYHLFVNDGLLMLMNDRLMVLMNNVLMMLMHHLLMMFMNHILVVLLDYGCIDVGLDPGCLSVLNDASLFGVSLNLWLLLVLENLSFLKGRLHDRLIHSLDHGSLLLSGDLLLLLLLHFCINMFYQKECSINYYY